MNIVNKKAYYEYFVLDEFEAGIVLLGGEVKSIRNGNISFNDSYIYINNGEIWLKNFKVARYKQMHKLVSHDDDREKKLLLTKSQIRKITKYLQNQGITCVPLKVFVHSNRIKIKIGVVKGKKLYDKKNAIKKKDINRDLDLNLK